MKGIYVIAVAFLASWSVCTANEDQQSVQQIESQDDIFRQCPYPDINPRNTTTHIAHESDCTKFYKCLLGRGTEQLCPLIWKNDPTKRLHFNRTAQVCDWPWNAGCELCPGKDQNGEYPPESWIADPKATNCRQYIKCKQNGQQEKATCGNGLCFSRTCQACVEDRAGGNCGDRIPDPGTTTTTATPNPDECKTGDRLPHDCDCGKYLQCYDNKDWILQWCDGGQHFSPTTKNCLPPDEAKCTLLPRKN
ncbi:hypothetical protein RF55_4007 [Lasius niger]|uniref:Chitin-binding type-2 domain-containing protein n=1 Tax=Lasius niger TaxID=67767 RepID=A0A0J7KYY9_LASNI|nr:hypothetical protein RF55_4007 [Lasius niger]